MRIKIPHSKIYGQHDVKILNDNKIDTINIKYSDNQPSVNSISSVSFQGFSLKENISTPSINIEDYDDNRNKSSDYISSLKGRNFASEDKYTFSWIENDSGSYVNVKWLLLHKTLSYPYGSSGTINSDFSFTYYTNYNNGSIDNDVVSTTSESSITSTKIMNNDLESIFQDNESISPYNYFYKFDSSYYPSYSWFWKRQSFQPFFESQFAPFYNIQCIQWVENEELHLLYIIPCSVEYYIPTTTGGHTSMVWIIQNGLINIKSDNISSTSTDYSVVGNGNKLAIEAQMVDSQENAKDIANNIIDYWEKGKRSITFNCLYSDYYDYDTGDVAISSNVLNIKNKNKTFNKPTLSYTKQSKLTTTNTAELNINSTHNFFRGSNEIIFAKVSLFDNNMFLVFPFASSLINQIEYTFSYNNIEYALKGYLSETTLLGNTLSLILSSTNTTPVSAKIETINMAFDLYSYSITLENPAQTDLEFQIKFTDDKNMLYSIPIEIKQGNSSGTVSAEYAFFYSSGYISNCSPISDNLYYYIEDLEYKGYELNGITNGFLSIGDIVIPMANESTPVIKNADNTPVEFIVTGIEYNYISYPYQTISAIEYIDLNKRLLSISMDNNTNITVKRTDSLDRNGYLGVLYNNDTIYAGDTLEINFSAVDDYMLSSITINEEELIDSDVSTFSTIIQVEDNVTITATSEEIPTFTLTKRSGSIGTITRTSSPMGGSIGPLSTGAVLYTNDILEISTDQDVGAYEIKNGTIIDSSNALIYGGIDKTITVQGNVSVYIRQAGYEWVDLSGGDLNTWIGLDSDIGGTYTTEIYVNGVRPRTDKIKDDYKKEYDISINYYNGYEIVEVPYIGIIGTDDLDLEQNYFSGSGFVVALNYTGNNYVVNYPGYGVRVEVDCVKDNYLTIKAYSNYSEYPRTCYFTEIKFNSIMQTEYH